MSSSSSVGLIQSPRVFVGLEQYDVDVDVVVDVVLPCGLRQITVVVDVV